MTTPTAAPPAPAATAPHSDRAVRLLAAPSASPSSPP
jgi:hypothetical protein